MWTGVADGRSLCDWAEARHTRSVSRHDHQCARLNARLAAPITTIAMVVILMMTTTVFAQSKHSPPHTQAQEAAHRRIAELKAGQPFWQWIEAPHGREIAVLLTQVETNRNIAANLSTYHLGVLQLSAVHERQRALIEALQLLRYATSLDPSHQGVMVTYAQIAAQAGETSLAISLLEQLLNSGSSSDNTDEAMVDLSRHHAALGTLYARRARSGDYDRASRHLEIGISSGSLDTKQQSLLAFANVEMERDHIDIAIDALLELESSAIPALMLALAVAYDRSDQPSRANAVLSTLRTRQALSRALLAPHSTEPIHFTLAADRHYYQALLYETSEQFAEARSEWLAYTKVIPPLRYRSKAQSHIVDIDRLTLQRHAVRHPLKPSLKHP